MDPLQQIAKELEIPLGHDIPTATLEWIRKAQGELSSLRSAPVAVGSLLDFADDSVIREAIKMGMMLEATKPAPVAVEVRLTIPDWETIEDYAGVFPRGSVEGTREARTMRRVYNYIEAHALTVPSSHILKNGEMAVPVEELEALRELLAHARVAVHEVEDNGECDMSAICDAVHACDAIRSGEAEAPSPTARGVGGNEEGLADEPASPSV